VTGGSQGALAINRAVAGWLDAGGAGNVSLLWVTGRATHAEFETYHRPPAVRVIDYLDPMADGYAVADLVVSRAGMITVAELCAWGLPSILVPLPTAAADHQSHNARVLAEAGAALLLRQDMLTPESLGQAVRGLLGNDVARRSMASRARARGRPLAAREIVSNLLTLTA
jgi:UDP-N-acetylglucosamine--N-acetylmuramyl-(pentapeptide) pyrophosphoryl-undecaprenol N-acetylglucosamine transferase